MRSLPSSGGAAGGSFGFSCTGATAGGSAAEGLVVRLPRRKPSPRHVTDSTHHLEVWVIARFPFFPSIFAAGLVAPLAKRPGRRVTRPDGNGPAAPSARTRSCAAARRARHRSLSYAVAPPSPREGSGVAGARVHAHLDELKPGLDHGLRESLSISL